MSYTLQSVREFKDSANAVSRQKLDNARKIKPEGEHMVVMTNGAVNSVRGYNIEAVLNNDDEITVVYSKQ